MYLCHTVREGRQFSSEAKHCSRFWCISSKYYKAFLPSKFMNLITIASNCFYFCCLFSFQLNSDRFFQKCKPKITRISALTNKQRSWRWINFLFTFLESTYNLAIRIHPSYLHLIRSTLHHSDIEKLPSFEKQMMYQLPTTEMGRIIFKQNSSKSAKVLAHGDLMRKEPRLWGRRI